MMEAIFILIVALAVGGEASPLSLIDLPPGLSVKFGLGIAMLPNRDFFHKIPMTIEEALEDDWILEENQPILPKIYQGLEMLCYDKYRYICALYDPCSNYVAGLQHAIPIANFTNIQLDMEANGFTIWNTSVGSFYSIAQFYLSELTLEKSCDKRKPYNSSIFLQEGRVYAPGTDKKIMAISADGGEVRTKTIFTQQACILWMGNHYYYNMTKTTQCTPEAINPYFLLVHGDNDRKQQTMGCCLMTFGNLALAPGARNFFEVPGENAVKAIVTDGPDCLRNDLAKYALTSHVYFTSKPEWMYC